MNIPRVCPRDYVVGSTDNDEAQPYAVYVLYCPALRRIVYVGQTHCALYYRLTQHVSEGNQFSYSPKQRWIRALRTVGLLPFMRRVARFPTKREAKEHEANLIRSIGARRKLYNLEGTPADGRLLKKNPCAHPLYGLFPEAVRAAYSTTSPAYPSSI